MHAETSHIQRRLRQALEDSPSRIIACSGGIDSLVLASIAHTQRPASTIVAHSRTPAVPIADTLRVQSMASQAGWDLRILESSELDDERYVSNPVNRCYFCKSHLYDALERLMETFTQEVDRPTVMSGANVDDLGEFRPGLKAAAERYVRHPFVEAGVTKAEIRMLAAELDVELADLPASPCLASRLYTGTRVTPQRLAAVSAGEIAIRRHTGVKVVRCRLRGDDITVEVRSQDRPKISPEVLEEAFAVMRAEYPALTSITIDPAPYRPGRSFVGMPGREVG